MTIGALPMACTEIGTEFSTAVPFTLGNATLIAAGGLSKPYNVSSWVGKSAGNNVTLIELVDSSLTYIYYSADSVLYPAGGSLSPTTHNGQTIELLHAQYATEGGAFEVLSLHVAGASVSQSFFTSMVLNGRTYTSASAIYNPNQSGKSTWAWGTPNPVVAAGAYLVTWT